MTDCNATINPLYNSYFRLVFGRGTKQMELMCQRANLPGITVPDQPQPTTLGVTIPVPTLVASFEPLTIEFVVDSQLTNWQSLYGWIRNITNIQDTVNYNLPGGYQDWHHFANLYVYDPSDRCEILKATFHYIIPTRLSGLVFQADSSDALIQKATCTFKYSYYNLWLDGNEVPADWDGQL